MGITCNTLIIHDQLLDGIGFICVNQYANDYTFVCGIQ